MEQSAAEEGNSYVIKAKVFVEIKNNFLTFLKLFCHLKFVFDKILRLQATFRIICWCKTWIEKVSKWLRGQTKSVSSIGEPRSKSHRVRQRPQERVRRRSNSRCEKVRRKLTSSTLKRRWTRVVSILPEIDTRFVSSGPRSRCWRKWNRQIYYFVLLNDFTMKWEPFRIHSCNLKV